MRIGCPGFKIHGWKKGNPQREIDIINAVGKRIETRMDIMYDASCHLQPLEDAFKIGRVCDE